MTTQLINKRHIKKICNVLRKGGIIIYPTETSYGIGCDATNKKAIKKIYDIKNRDRNKPLITLVQNEKMAEKYIKLNKVSRKLLKKFSNRPLTLVCDSKLLPNILGENSFRISSDKFVQKLIRSYKKPITSTSANISGSEALFKIAQVKKVFGGKVDLIVDGGTLKKKKLSTVFDTRSLKVLRKGAISSKEIYETISKSIVICGGCFNIAHKGHEYFLKKAKSKGDYLIVVVSNDKRNREKYGKYAKSALVRKIAIENLWIADKVVVGDKGNIFNIIKKEKAGIVVLGYDQKNVPKDVKKKYNLKISRIDKLNL